MRLHLGCGERYLPGYRNIDFPPTEHTVQTNTRVDEYADILQLRYPRESIDEIRLHHVFEHFSRPTAHALLAAWWSWLAVGGLLRVEVPDFDRTAWAVINPLSSNRARYVALRHIFGSQEAAWALHQEGWSPSRMKQVFAAFGFERAKVTKNTYMGTYNFEVIAFKTQTRLSRDDFERRTLSSLSRYCINDTITERNILDTWMSIYRRQIEASWAT